jgi:hypothetical protein
MGRMLNKIVALVKGPMALDNRTGLGGCPEDLLFLGITQ